MEITAQKQPKQQPASKAERRNAFVPGVLVGLFLGYIIRKASTEQRKHRTIIDVSNE